MVHQEYCKLKTEIIATVRMEDALLDKQRQIRTKFAHTPTLLSWVGLPVCTF